MRLLSRKLISFIKIEESFLPILMVRVNVDIALWGPGRRNRDTEHLVVLGVCKHRNVRQREVRMHEGLEKDTEPQVTTERAAAPASQKLKGNRKGFVG